MLVHWPLETCFRLDTVTSGGFRRLGLQPKILEQWKHQQHGVVFESKAQALSLDHWSEFHGAPGSGAEPSKGSAAQQGVKRIVGGLHEIRALMLI